MENEEFRRNQRGVIWFLLATFGITWALWSLLWILDVQVPDPRHLPIVKPDPRFALLTGPVMWVPGVVALVVTRLSFDENWRSTTLNRLGSWRYWVAAWIVVVFVIVASAALSVALGAARLDREMSFLRAAWSGSALRDASFPAFVAIDISLAFLLNPLIDIVATMGEELGWRGFLLPRLVKSGMNEWQALAASGAIWGIWHAPLVARGWDFWGHPVLGPIMMVVFCTMFGIVVGWLRLASGSVWVPAFAHGVLNGATPAAVSLLVPGFDYAIAGTPLSAIGWISTGTVIIWLLLSGRLRRGFSVQGDFAHG